MTGCIGWLLDVSIDNYHVILWIKTEEGQTVTQKVPVLLCQGW